MSKIEKALRKARQEGGQSGQAMVKLHRQKEPEHKPVSSNSVNLSVETNASAEIALMHQPESLDVHQRLAKKIIYPEAAENDTIKALREIRTKIAQKTSSGNCVIMVTGTSLGSGATFIAVNLAAAFALDAARTSLVVDCNIRDPYLHNLVGGDIKVGLTNYLTDSHCDIADVILPTGIARLRVIPAGVNIDATVEYFTMDRMKRLIRSIRERYPDRHIILDCPPLARSADTQILMELCDYVLIVVPYARATTAKLHTALKLFDNRKLLGVIINEEPRLPPVDWMKSLSSFSSGLLRRVNHIAMALVAKIRKQS
jgi:Mrp family chromosome partitioning ATPase